MKNKSSSATGGVGVTGLLQVALIVLKLCGVIKWSWWWVLAPSWIAALIGVALLAVALILALLVE